MDVYQISSAFWFKCSIIYPVPNDLDYFGEERKESKQRMCQINVALDMTVWFVWWNCVLIMEMTSNLSLHFSIGVENDRLAFHIVDRLPFPLNLPLQWKLPLTVGLGVILLTGRDTLNLLSYEFFENHFSYFLGISLREIIFSHLNNPTAKRGKKLLKLL